MLGRSSTVCHLSTVSSLTTRSSLPLPPPTFLACRRWDDQWCVDVPPGFSGQQVFRWRSGRSLVGLGVFRVDLKVLPDADLVDSPLRHGNESSSSPPNPG